MRSIRAVGIVLLAASLIAMALDVPWLGDEPGRPLVNSIADFWRAVHPSSLLALSGGGTPWSKLFEKLIAWPVWLLPASAGVALTVVAICRRKRAPGGASAASAVQASSIATHRILYSELGAALASCRGILIGIALFSAISNVLMLTGSFFMLQVYDRVLPSRSVPTLVALTVLVVILFAAQGILDFIRGRLLVRTAIVLDEALSGRVYEAAVQIPLRLGSRLDATQPVRDLDSVRSFLSSAGPVALFDLPWVLLYLGIIYLFHPLLGLVAFAGALLLTALTFLTEVRTRGPLKAATEYSIARHRLTDASVRNAEVLAANGLSRRLASRWREANRAFINEQQRASDMAGGFGSISRVLRMMLQSGVLAVGAWLVISQQATAGIIIAGAILTARALAPVDLAIANWQSFVRARQSWQRLGGLLAQLPAAKPLMRLPAPTGGFRVESASVAPPGEQTLTVHDVTFALTSCQGLGVIGPSGSGKSSLARAMVGVWPLMRGRISLDRATLDQWSPEDLGRHIGYLPQDVELFAGTVAENIGRFDEEADAEAILAAARLAAVHDLIVSLPKGYETRIGEPGAELSPGQQQRIGLARALYGDPFLVVLDEPDASLDRDGQQALGRAIAGVRARGGIVVVISHRANVIEGVDLLLAMQRGRMVAFGPKELVLQKMRRPAGQAVETLKVVTDTGRLKT